MAILLVVVHVVRSSGRALRGGTRADCHTRTIPARDYRRDKKQMQRYLEKVQTH